MYHKALQSSSCLSEESAVLYENFCVLVHVIVSGISKDTGMS